MFFLKNQAHTIIPMCNIYQQHFTQVVCVFLSSGPRSLTALQYLSCSWDCSLLDRDGPGICWSHSPGRGSQSLMSHYHWYNWIWPSTSNLVLPSALPLLLLPDVAVTTAVLFSSSTTTMTSWLVSTCLSVWSWSPEGSYLCQSQPPFALTSIWI